jgi:DNA-directed RNA polymerase subunit RPC12/RpoP
MRVAADSRDVRPDTVTLDPAELQSELLRRQRLDQTARRAVEDGSGKLAQVMELDADNTAWLKAVVETVGWPGVSLVGEEGARAAWLLAQHADRDQQFQRRCAELVKRAVRDGEASPADLAYLTDRVLVNSCRPQLYGTQLTARDGRFLPQRLEDPDSVDERRASVGLEPLEEYVRRATEQHGAPVPMTLRCRGCGGGVTIWAPAPGESTSAACPSCGRRVMVRGHPPGARIPAGTRTLSGADLTPAAGQRR